MPAHVMPPSDQLEVVLYRTGQPPVRLTAETGGRAMIRGLQLLLRESALRPGGTLVCNGPGDDGGPHPDLPQVSRAAHYS